MNPLHLLSCLSLMLPALAAGSNGSSVRCFWCQYSVTRHALHQSVVVETQELSTATVPPTAQGFVPVEEASVTPEAEPAAVEPEPAAAAEPASQPAGEPAPQPAGEPAPQPVAAAEPASQPAGEPAPQPAAAEPEPAAAAEPALQPAGEPAPQPAAAEPEPAAAAEPASQLAGEPAPQPAAAEPEPAAAAEPALQPAGEPAPQPVAAEPEPAAAAEPALQPAGEPAPQPAAAEHEPAAAAEPASQIAGEPAPQPAAAEPEPAAAAEPASQPAGEPAPQPASAEELVATPAEASAAVTAAPGAEKTLQKEESSSFGLCFLILFVVGLVMMAACIVFQLISLSTISKRISMCENLLGVQKAKQNELPGGAPVSEKIPSAMPADDTALTSAVSAPDAAEQAEKAAEKTPLGEKVPSETSEKPLQNAEPEVMPEKDGEKSPQRKPWAIFAETPLPAALQHPYPDFIARAWYPGDDDEMEECGVDSLITLEQADAYAELPHLRKMAEECRSSEFQRESCRRFIRFAADRPDGAGLLFHPLSAQEHFWFVGDVHGSLTAVLKVLGFLHERIEQLGKSHTHRLIFLGDALDRGPETLPLLVLIQQLLMKESESFRVHFVRGNHDVGLRRQADGRYSSTVLPSETADELNALAKQDAELAQLLAESAMELGRISPCMGELTNLGGNEDSNTILFTHGGVPHVDLQERLYAAPMPEDQDVDFISTVPEELRAAVCKDFTWLRMVERLPKKMPNRGSSGCDIGTEDINKYRRMHYERTGRAVSFIIRGHDHRNQLDSYDSVYHNSSARFQKNCGVLTIQTREPDAEEGSFSANRDLAVVHWCRNESLQLHLLPTHHIGAEPKQGVPAPAVAAEVVTAPATEPAAAPAAALSPAPEPAAEHSPAPATPTSEEPPCEDFPAVPAVFGPLTPQEKQSF